MRGKRAFVPFPHGYLCRWPFPQCSAGVARDMSCSGRLGRHKPLFASCACPDLRSQPQNIHGQKGLDNCNFGVTELKEANQNKKQKERKKWKEKNKEEKENTLKALFSIGKKYFIFFKNKFSLKQTWNVTSRVSFSGGGGGNCNVELKQI